MIGMTSVAKYVRTGEQTHKSAVLLDVFEAGSVFLHVNQMWPESAKGDYFCSV
jgi:hypothetical protein